MKKVLVLEEQKSIRDFITYSLRYAGFEPVDELSTDVVAVILDDASTQVDCFEFCQSIREQNAQIPILMLTSRGNSIDQLTGLMTGADDHLVKPFSPAALIGRLEALLHRVRLEAVRVEELVSSGPFILDTRGRTLEKFGEKIRLTQAEYSVVKLLMQNPGHDFSKEEILGAVWGPEGDIKQVDLTIRRLRIKLEDAPDQPVFIITVWGHGYKWCG